MALSSRRLNRTSPCTSDVHDMVVVAGLITAPESHGGALQPAANATVLASGSAQTSSSSATNQPVVQQVIAMDSVLAGVQVQTKPSQLPSAVPHSGAAQPAAAAMTAISAADQTGAAQAAVDVSMLARGPAQTSGSSATSASVFSQAHGPPHSDAGQLASTSRTLSIAAEQTSSSSAACGAQIAQAPVSARRWGSASPVPHSGIQPRTSEAPQRGGERCMGIQPCTFLWTLATCNCLFQVLCSGA